MPKEKHLGPVDMTGVEIEIKEETEEEKQRKIRVANKPPIDECLSLYDFEAVAKSILPTAAWAYCESCLHFRSFSADTDLGARLLNRRLFWCGRRDHHA